MRTNYYDLYIKSVFDLAKTLVIKSEYSALTLNTYCRMYYGADSYVDHDKTTWKYYLNISGEYHNTDTSMVITSLDTLQDIEFNKANLIAHPATRAAYKFDTRYYRELVLKYPQQEQLILGIIYPTDINKAIAAPDFTVLTYPEDLIEEGEVSLVKRINEWLDHFSIRWNNKQFTLTDTYYGAALLSVMYSNLVPLIITLRLKACKTDEAHSYHIREFLASHCFLDVYLNQMTRFQALFFYRNIRYIQRNNGKTDVFEWLTDKIMTHRNLPLSEYSMKHDVHQMPGKLTPDVSFRRRLLNTGVQAIVSPDNYNTLDHILAKELPLVKGNADFIKFNKESIRASFERSKSSSIATKMLVSSVTDYTDAVPYTLHEALLNHWMYYTQKDLYTATLPVVNPKSGETFNIHARDAYIYYLYAFAKSIGITLTKLPGLLVRRVQRGPIPDLQDIMKVVDTKYVTVEDANFVRGMNPVVSAMPSQALFQSTVEAIHHASMKQSNFIGNQEHEYKRGLVHAMVSRMYCDEYLETQEIGTDYSEWLVNNRLAFQDLSAENWHDMSLNLYEAATGYKMNVTKRIADLQKAMVRLFEQLSSYSIQFITDINQASVKVVNWAAIRVGDIKGAGRAYYEIQLSIFKIFELAWSTNAKYAVELSGLKIWLKAQLQPWRPPPVELTFGVSRNKMAPRAIVNLGNQSLVDAMDMSKKYNSLADFRYNELFFALPKADQDSYKSIHNHCFIEPFYPDQIDTADLMMNTNLPGFVYQAVGKNFLNAFKYFYIPKFSYKFMDLNTEVELDAFYSNYGALESDVFEWNGGVVKVQGINLMTGVPIDGDIGSLQYSGGWTGVTEFEPALATDQEREIPDFKWSGQSADIEFVPGVFFKQIEDITNTIKKLEFDLSNVRGEKTLPTDFRNTLEEHTTGGLENMLAEPDVQPIASNHERVLFDDLKADVKSKTLDDLHETTHMYSIDLNDVFLTKDISLANSQHTRDLADFRMLVGSHLTLMDDMVMELQSKTLNGLGNTLQTKTIPNFAFQLHYAQFDLLNWGFEVNATPFNLVTSHHVTNMELVNSFYVVEITLD